MRARCSCRSPPRPATISTYGSGGSRFGEFYGYAVPEAAWWLGIPGPLYTLMLNLVGLVLALLAIIFLLQNWSAIADWIGGDGLTTSGWGRVRRTLADIWQLLAIFYIVGLYAIYALRIEGGFVYVARATALSVVVIVAARVIARFIRGLSRRGFAVSPHLKAQFPTLEQRANRYVPILTGLASGALYILAALTVLQAWEVSAFAWLDSGFARRLGGDLLSIGMIVLAALAVWEIFASAIERYLGKIDAGGGAAAYPHPHPVAVVAHSDAVADRGHERADHPVASRHQHRAVACRGRRCRRRDRLR